MNNGNSYIAFCLTEFRKAGFTKPIYTDFDETSKAIRKLIELLVSRLICEVSKMKNPNDILGFVEQYEAENKMGKKDIGFKRFCKTILVVLPTLKLSSKASPILTNFSDAYILELINIHESIILLCQEYGMLMVVQEAIGFLRVSNDGWSFYFNSEDNYKTSNRFHLAIKEGALNGYCDNIFIYESFLNTYRDVFRNIEDRLWRRVFATHFVYDINKFTEVPFLELIKGKTPQKGIIDVTDIVMQNKQEPCIKGLLFNENNSNLLMAFLKPHNQKYRTRFRPILKINIDGIDKYITTQDIYYESLLQLALGQFAHNELPEEWKNVKVLKDTAKKISQQHSKTLEDTIEQSLKKDNYSYLRNIKSLSNIDFERAPVIINGKSIKGKTVGEIDFIIISNNNKSIFVVDAKYLKPTFFYTSFPVDADKFRKESGYEDKLSYKVQWLSDNTELLSKQLNRPDILSYKVEGFFVTNNLIYYSLFSKYPIIPIKDFMKYISTKDRYCFLPNI